MQKLKKYNQGIARGREYAPEVLRNRKLCACMNVYRHPCKSCFTSFVKVMGFPGYTFKTADWTDHPASKHTDKLDYLAKQSCVQGSVT